MAEDIEAEVEVDESEVNQDDDWGRPWISSESMLWLSDQARSPSSDAAGSEESITRH